MINSMTGFGRGEGTGSHKQVVVEIKSVNHRYHEIAVRMSRPYGLLEDRIKKYIQNHISRGRIEVYAKLEDIKPALRGVVVDKELALAYYKALKELAVLTGAEMDLGLSQIAQLPEVLRPEEVQEDLEGIWEDVKEPLQKAVNSLVEMRRIEGGKLAADLRKGLSVIEDIIAMIEEKSPRTVAMYKEKLTGRIKEILEDGQVEENRLALEVALFADRCCIAEELVRLKSHREQFCYILKENNPVGRKLDFLLQEMNRETNTIGSKGNDLEISQHVVALKSELEKLREQIQNIE